MRKTTEDLVPGPDNDLRWDISAALESLEKCSSSVDAEVTRSIEWYYSRRRMPALTARAVRWSAVLATVVGGLYPIWARVIAPSATLPELGYPLLTLAAALIAIDRFGGLSSAWMRYIVTAQALTREQRMFRLDWNEMRSRIETSGELPSYQQLTPLFDRLKTFATRHDELVESETRTWIAEFRSVLSELGRTSKKEESDSASLEKSPPPPVPIGSVELIVEGGEQAEGDFVVGFSGVRRAPVRGNRLRFADVPAGPQSVMVEGKVDGARAVWTTDIIHVKPGNVVRATARRTEPSSSVEDGLSKESG